MKAKDKKYIERRLKLLDGTAKELKKVFKYSCISSMDCFKKFKNMKISPTLTDRLAYSIEGLKDIEDLYLEIECYVGEIKGRLNLMEKKQ